MVPRVLERLCRSAWAVLPTVELPGKTSGGCLDSQDHRIRSSNACARRKFHSSEGLQSKVSGRLTVGTLPGLEMCTAREEHSCLKNVQRRIVGWLIACQGSSMTFFCRTVDSTAEYSIVGGTSSAAVQCNLSLSSSMSSREGRLEKIPQCYRQATFDKFICRDVTKPSNGMLHGVFAYSARPLVHAYLGRYCH